MQRYLYSRFECFVKSTDSVACHDEDTIIVLKYTEKNYISVSAYVDSVWRCLDTGNKAVTLKISDASLLEKYIGLIQKKH